MYEKAISACSSYTRKYGHENVKCWNEKNHLSLQTRTSSEMNYIIGLEYLEDFNKTISISLSAQYFLVKIIKHAPVVLAVVFMQLFIVL